MTAHALVERVAKMTQRSLRPLPPQLPGGRRGCLWKDSAPEGFREVNGFEDGDVYPGQSIR